MAAHTKLTRFTEMCFFHDWSLIYLLYIPMLLVALWVSVEELLKSCGLCDSAVNVVLTLHCVKEPAETKSHKDILFSMRENGRESDGWIAAKSQC